MKRSLSRKAVIIVLVFFLVLSVGYAVFNQSITISGTATAKGELQLTTTCGITPFTSDEVGDNVNEISNYEPNGFSQANCETSGNSITMTSAFSYPGANVQFYVKVVNNNDFSVILDLDEWWQRYNSNKNVTCLLDDTEVDCEDSKGWLFSIEGFASYIIINNVQYGKGDQPVIGPGQAAYIVYNFDWDSSDEDNNNKERKLIFSDYFKFIQVVE